jgi:3-oxoacyl-[acyl-carrier-protein] synthase II
MELALADARLVPRQISYLNAHAASTPLGDRAEAHAIQQVFGDCVHDLLVSSTKSMTGHLLGGAGSLEAGLTVLALRDQIAPPMTNLENVDPVCAFKIVTKIPTPLAMEYAMSNSFGFGGTNASIIFRKVAEESATEGASIQTNTRSLCESAHNITASRKNFESLDSVYNPIKS